MMPIVKMLEEYIEKKPLRLHMPAHKGRLNESFLADFSLYDVTELDVTDNLFDASGAILESERLYADLFGAKYAYFSVNGSSSGNIAFAALSKRAAVDRLSHKSVFSALELLKKDCVVIERREKNGWFAPISLDDVIKTTELYPDIDTFILTSPDYYGRTLDLKSIYAYLKDKNIKLFVDSAHGAHFGLNSRLPENAVKSCDACIVSVHKTMGGLNQTAVLLLDNDKLSQELKKSLYAFMTSSPSFGLLASIDYAREFCRLNAKGYDELYEKRLEFDKKIEKLGLFTEKTDDFTRLVINCSSWGIAARELYKALERENVFFEMYDERRFVAILTLFDSADVFDLIYSALKGLERTMNKGTSVLPLNETVKNDEKHPIAFLLKKNIGEREVTLRASVGMYSAEEVLRMPPCIPVLLVGELITEEKIRLIEGFTETYFGKRKTTIKVIYEGLDNL